MSATVISVCCGLWYIFWSFVKMYIFGFLALLRQIFQPHKVSALHLQTGKVAIVTGGAAGIGYHVSKGLVAKNIHVIIAGRCTEEGKQAIQSIREEFPNAKVDFLLLDLASFQSIQRFVDNFLARELPLHILINNAGVMFMPYKETQDGLEYHFQVNFLGHLYLTRLLLQKLCTSGADNCYSRIINVSSIVHNTGCLRLEKFGERPAHWWQFSPHAAYADSKLFVVLSSCWLDHLLKGDNSRVTVNALHPGIVNTQLYCHVHWTVKWLLDIVAAFTYKSPDQGADTVLSLALSDEVEGISGHYFDNCTDQKSCQMSYCLQTIQEFWDRSCDILKQHIPPENE